MPRAQPIGRPIGARVGSLLCAWLLGCVGFATGFDAGAQEPAASDASATRAVEARAPAANASSGTDAEAAAESLRARFAELGSSPRVPIGDAIYLQAGERDGRLQGQVHARVPHPWRAVRETLTDPERWCEILIIHPNVKYCRASGDGPTGELDVGLGRNFEEPLSDAHMLRFDFQLRHDGPEYLQVSMSAPTGPLGTSDYRIELEAAPLDAQRSILHLSYAHAFGSLARAALETYLATFGGDKVGFTVTGRTDAGDPIHVGGLRGLIERNTMRYYLAIDAHLGTRNLPEPERLPQALRNWYEATGRHPEQLRELERDAYLEMKENEIERQRTEWPQPGVFGGP